VKTEALVLPHDPEWNEARRAWNLAVDQQPAAVALPESAEDVAAVVRWARTRGLRIAPQGTGHSAGAMGSLAHTVLVKTERMRGVEIDAERRVARVEAGVLWEEVSEEAAEHGLAALAGSSPDVGVVGYTLGGGISWLGRRYGLAANNVVAVELVNADGEHVRADAAHEPELFWALRGGGGSFGIVTALEFTLFPISEVYAGILFFPLERGRAVLRAWRRWVEDVPEEVTSVARFLRFPSIPDIPEHLRGGSFVVVEATFLLEESEAEALLRPLRDLGPAMDTFATIPVEQLRHLHMDPEHPVPGVGDGMLLEDFPAEAIDAMVAVAGSECRSPLLSVEVRHLGGALARTEAGHGALASIEAGFAMFAVGIAMTPELGAAVRAHVEVVQSAFSRWDAGRDYLNFTERRERAGRFYGELTHRRLQAVKSKVDPEDVFRSNHPIRLPAKRLRKVA
jgi:FAD binding domain/Berberine and berberine like